MPESLRKVNAPRAQDIYQHFDLTEDAAGIDDGEQPPAAFLNQLIEEGHYEDATRFLAHAMPKREAVWWACLAARTVTLREDAAADHVSALKAAEAWVFEPTETNRRTAEKLAEKTSFKHPSSWAAIAAFWSGASITGEDEPPVPPPPHLYAHAVTGAIMLAAALDNPDHIKPKLDAFLKQGIDIANGGNGQISNAA